MTQENDFKIGDRVEWRCVGQRMWQDWDGQQGTIVGTDGERNYRVKWDDPHLQARSEMRGFVPYFRFLIHVDDEDMIPVSKIREAVMNHPEGCKDGKLKFLKDNGWAEKKPRKDCTYITLEISESFDDFEEFETFLQTNFSRFYVASAVQGDEHSDLRSYQRIYDEDYDVSS